jgi:DNA mismatch repair protein MutL
MVIMIKRIQPLPIFIANQIAAGEVIERPASVVKELLENAYDAGATAIMIDIEHGGLNRIQISDNGHGILEDDLPLAIAPHATSKIIHLDDLYAIDTMGFRGEALASISSVAELTIQSKPSHQTDAMSLTVQGERYTLQPCARNVGTTIDVRGLFDHAPVRKKFLKSARLEFQAIEAVVRRFALCESSIAVKLTHDEHVILDLPSATTPEGYRLRLLKLLGKSFMDSALPIQASLGSMQLEGVISSATYQRSQMDKQWMYVNRRIVRDKLLNHALKKAYDDLLYPGRFPACVLYLTLPASEVDINVHPSKYEVRFESGRIVHDLMVSSIQRALSLEKQPVPEVKSVFVKPQLTSQIPLNGRWIDLKEDMVMIEGDLGLFLVDGQVLYQRWLKKRLEQHPYPWASRPLLVPLRFTATASLSLNLLLSFGLDGHFVSENTFLVRTLPLLLPQLDLNQIMPKIMALTHQTLESIQQVLLTHHGVHLSALDHEEKSAMMSFLWSIVPSSGYLKGLSKPLSKKHCVEWLNA